MFEIFTSKETTKMMLMIHPSINWHSFLYILSFNQTQQIYDMPSACQKHDQFSLIDLILNAIRLNALEMKIGLLMMINK